MLRAAPLVTLIALLSTPAGATGEIVNLITAADQKRLDAYDATRKQAVEEAQAGSPSDRAVLAKVLDAPPLPWSDFDLTGDWECRTIKAGGLADLVVYGWFKCRVTDDGAGWTLTKLTGSQRTKGRFFTDSDTRLTYLGSLGLNNDPFPAYGANPDSDQVGYAFRTGAASWRIEFPAPRYESKLDVLELRR